jgi:hypothetical protein
LYVQTPWSIPLSIETYRYCDMYVSYIYADPSRVRLGLFSRFGFFQLLLFPLYSPSLFSPSSPHLILLIHPLHFPILHAPHAPHHTAHYYDRKLVKTTLQPFIHEDGDNVNHIKCDVYIILGQNYPNNPLFSIFVDAVGMDERKTELFEDVIKKCVADHAGDNNGTTICVISGTKKFQKEIDFKKEFFDAVQIEENHKKNINQNPTKNPGDVYLFELFESIREWLINNNTREAKSLRDTVSNIDAIDEAERLRLEQANQVEEEKPQEYIDPYDIQDNVFVQEYDSGIELPAGQICTTEVFEHWSAQFLEAQNIRRIKLLAEAGKIDDSTQMTGKQLFLSNLINELVEEEGAAGYTFIKPKFEPINAENLDENDGDDFQHDDTLDNTPLGGDIDLDAIESLDINEDLFGFSDDDSDNDAVSTAKSPTIAPTPTQPQQPLITQPLVEKKSSANPKKDKKDDKKDKKGKKGSKKDTKTNGIDLGGGFSDFLGDF